MDILETVAGWVRSFPLWEAGNLLYIDYTDAAPGNTGLYPAGIEEISRRKDILGNVYSRCRCNFALYRVGRSPKSGADSAWLLAFQQWVLQQSRENLAPALGEDTQWKAEKGKLREHSQPGTGVYWVQLTAEYTEKTCRENPAE